MYDNEGKNMKTKAKRQHKTTANRSIRVPMVIDEAIMKCCKQKECSYVSVVLDAVRKTLNVIEIPDKESPVFVDNETPIAIEKEDCLTRNHPYLKKYILD